MSSKAQPSLGSADLPQTTILTTPSQTSLLSVSHHVVSIASDGPVLELPLRAMELTSPFPLSVPASPRLTSPPTSRLCSSQEPGTSSISCPLSLYRHGPLEFARLITSLTRIP